jgi:hypothetical protein
VDRTGCAGMAFLAILLGVALWTLWLIALWAVRMVHR